MQHARRWLSVRSAFAAGALVAAVLSTASVSRAEGSTETGSSQALQAWTFLYVDIVDPATETFVWTGKGRVSAFSPQGTQLGLFTSGSTIDPVAGETGAYVVRPLTDQFDADSEGTVVAAYDWDITVFAGETPVLGRVWSDCWYFNAGRFAADRATDASFYALVPGGEPGKTAVVELDLEGLAGFIYFIAANRVGPGVDGAYTGLSVPAPEGEAVEFEPEHPIYLNPPERADYARLSPTIDSFVWNASDQGQTDCDTPVVGEPVGTFSFETNAVGTYHIVCDFDDNGLDLTSATDLHLVGPTTPGANTAVWDGTDNQGLEVPPGSYPCELRVTVGEFHYVGHDIETSYPGMRMYEVLETGERNPLRMYWNDALVQQNAVTMQNGDLGAQSSGPEGVLSSEYGAEALPHGETTPGNARAWGDFGATEYEDPPGSGTWVHLGKGNEALLDTYTWLDHVVSGTVTVPVSDDSDGDSDGDGLADLLEECELGTHADDPDSDGDSIGDFVETDGGSATDTDGDGTLDSVDRDSDQDGVRDVTEAGDTDLSTPPVDTDGDDTPDYRDADDDGDGVDTLAEDADGDGDPTDDDTDDDGTPDYLDAEDSASSTDVDAGSGADAGADDDDDDVNTDDDAAADDDDDDASDDDDDDDVNTDDDDDNASDDDDDDDDASDDDDDGDAGTQQVDDVDGDGVDSDEDCDDSDPEIGEEVSLYADRDKDGFGDPDDEVKSCDPEKKGYAAKKPDNCPETSNPNQRDQDEDDIGDACDACPDVEGLVRYKGCPSGDDQEVSDRGGCGCRAVDRSNASSAAAPMLALLALALIRRRATRAR